MVYVFKFGAHKNQLIPEYHFVIMIAQQIILTYSNMAFHLSLEKGYNWLISELKTYLRFDTWDRCKPHHIGLELQHLRIALLE